MPLAAANTYAIFGAVVDGMDVVDAIHAASDGEEFPANPIGIAGMGVLPE